MLRAAAIVRCMLLPRGAIVPVVMVLLVLVVIVVMVMVV